MAVFTYKAINGNRAVQGTISADSARQAREQLRARGLLAQQMQEVGAVQTTQRPFSGLRRSHPAELLTWIRELATLLGAGIPLLEAQQTLIQQHRGGFRTALELLRDEVAAGSPLAQAMARQGRIFDPLCVHMVEVGENAGNLDEVLDQLASFRERNAQLKDRVVTALIYPAIVMLTSIVVTVFLMTYVVPMLLENLTEAGRPLPWPTRVLKFLSDILLAYGWWMLAGLTLSALAVVTALKTATGQQVWHRTVLRLPLVGSMVRRQAISRASLVIATLLKSGIVFDKSVEIAASSSRNSVIRDALRQCCRDVQTGQDIGPSLAASGAFPPMVVQIFSVGQQSGRLEEMLYRLAEDYDRQVATLAQRLTSALDPLLIVGLSIVVGFILFATVLPILEAGNVL